MLSTNQKIWHLINSDESLKKALRLDLVNVRAVAKYLITTYKLNTSLDSVISAIRRYEDDDELKKEEKAIVDVFKDCIIQTRNNLICVTIDKNSFSELFSIFKNNELEYNSRIAKGTNVIKIFVDKEDYLKIKKKLGPNIKHVQEGLGEMSIFLNEKVSQMRGILAKIANELSLYRINILEMIICVPQFIIYVKEEDMLKTHEAIIKFRQGQFD